MPRTTAVRKSAFGAIVAPMIAAATPAAAECNPLTFLFGQCAVERAAPVLAPESLAASSRHAQNTKKPAVRPAPAKRAPAAQGPTQFASAAPVGSLARFAADKTLRSGDIVVTTEGFKVYREGRFAPIAHDDGALAALEKASMRQAAIDYAGAIRTDVSPQASVRPDPAGMIALRSALRMASRE